MTCPMAISQKDFLSKWGQGHGKKLGVEITGSLFSAQPRQQEVHRHPRTHLQLPNEGATTSQYFCPNSYLFLQCDKAVRGELLANITLSGGNTRFPGMEKRVYQVKLSLPTHEQPLYQRKVTFTYTYNYTDLYQRIAPKATD